jgi:hydroxymethylglutaryl-CoA lyase
MVLEEEKRPAAKFKLIECPRDAMQGWKTIIPTEKKIEYLQTLLKVGFDTLDFGSFVSPKAIPQMADTRQVLEKLDTGNTKTKLLAIIANTRGAEEACSHEKISYLGFPFSISDTFQKRNTNSSIQESLTRVEEIQALCLKKNKQLVIYISMAFGNPYGDAYSEQLVLGWVEQLISRGIRIISLADTVGVAKADQVYSVTSQLIRSLPTVEIGVHLHSRPDNWKAKIDAAVEAGCLRFDGALKGFGGCPMAEDELVGNMNTELLIPYFKSINRIEGIDFNALEVASSKAAEIFQN